MELLRGVRAKCQALLSGAAKRLNFAIATAYVVLGIGIAATGIAPVSVTIANWFTYYVLSLLALLVALPLILMIVRPSPLRTAGARSHHGGFERVGAISGATVGEPFTRRGSGSS